jgi:toxin ParE1/3/4
MKYRLHPLASRELYDAAHWYDEHASPRIADDLLVEFERTIGLIAEHPHRWPRWIGTPPSPVIRKAMLDRFPYLLPYYVSHSEVVVLAFAHMKRRPLYWLRRGFD